MKETDELINQLQMNAALCISVLKSKGIDSKQIYEKCKFIDDIILEEALKLNDHKYDINLINIDNVIIMLMLIYRLKKVNDIYDLMAKSAGVSRETLDNEIKIDIMSFIDDHIKKN